MKKKESQELKTFEEKLGRRENSEDEQFVILSNLQKFTN